MKTTTLTLMLIAALVSACGKSSEDSQAGSMTRIEEERKANGGLTDAEISAGYAALEQQRLRYENQQLQQQLRQRQQQPSATEQYHHQKNLDNAMDAIHGR